MKIAIYNENCIHGGHEVSDWDGESESCDWTIYDGNPEELYTLAKTLEAQQSCGYDWRVAQTILNELELQYPS